MHTHPISRYNSAFTLIELLVVIAIIAILAVVVVLTLNPSNLLAQSRDANRVSDMTTLNNAVNLYVTDQANGTLALGTGSTTYLDIPDTSSLCNNQGLPVPAYPYHCSTAANYRNASTTGWIPINFQTISAGSPLSVLPIDPVNATSSNLYYTYTAQSGQYVISSFMESSKYAKNMGSTGGSDPATYQMGSGILTMPSAGRGLLGYWPFNEGSGTTAYDWSPTGINATYPPGIAWTTGKTGASALVFPTNTAMSFPGESTSTLPTTQMTATGWINVASLTGANNPIILTANWGGSVGSWVLGLTISTGKPFFGINNGSSVLANCSTALPPASWQFVAGTYNAATITVYLNGVSCGTAALVGQTLTGSSDVRVNNGNTSTTVSLNDIRLYNRALSAGEILQIYNAEK